METWIFVPVTTCPIVTYIPCSICVLDELNVILDVADVPEVVLVVELDWLYGATVAVDQELPL